MIPLSFPALLTSLGLAVAVAAHVSTWGAYKDSPYEGYHPLRQVRTLALAGLAAVGVLGAGPVGWHSLLPALGVVYALERLATEWWKTILRTDDQSAYAIPMRLGYRGRPVDVDRVRWSVGVLVALGLVGTGVLVHQAQDAVGPLPLWLVVATVGGLGGWATALGGAWKDAPVEGFSFWKFLRSPGVATAWALPLSLLTSDWVTLCLAAGGMAVASIETYKTFFTGGRPPGKFEGKPVRWVQPAVRRAQGAGHAAGWLAFAVVALTQSSLAGAPGAAAVASAVCVVSVVAAVGVLRSVVVPSEVTGAPADERRSAGAGIGGPAA